MVKKPFKIVKSKLFKKQVAKLPKGAKKELDAVLKKIAKNPMGIPGSMSLFGDPSPQELKQWMRSVRVASIDLVLEYLCDKGCLNKRGKKLAHDFWEEYIHEK